SADGEASGWHASVPLTQYRTPEAQTPWSPVRQAPPPPGLPWSAKPSQSLSRPSQISSDAGVTGTQVQEEPSHCVTPSAQTPGSPVAQGSPLTGQPSSISP